MTAFAPAIRRHVVNTVGLTFHIPGLYVTWIFPISPRSSRLVLSWSSTDRRMPCFHPPGSSRRFERSRPVSARHRHPTVSDAAYDAPHQFNLEMQAEAWSGSRRTWRGLHELAGLRQARAATDHDARVRRAVRRSCAGSGSRGGRGNVRRDRPRADDLRMAGAVTLRVAVSLFRERHHRSRCGDQARDAVLPVLRRPRGQPL